MVVKLSIANYYYVYYILLKFQQNQSAITYSKHRNNMLKFGFRIKAWNIKQKEKCFEIKLLKF